MAHNHPADAARRAKRDAAVAVGVDADLISRMVDQFYAKVRDDPVLGPIFAKRIDHWEPHLVRMKAFWRSVLHNSGEFSGTPMAKHMAIPEIKDATFAKWLELFEATLEEISLSSQGRILTMDKAAMIAASLAMGIQFHRRSADPQD